VQFREVWHFQLCADSPIRQRHATRTWPSFRHFKMV
jgi:hypothetical protein